MRSVQKHKLSNTKKFLIVLLVFIVLFCLSLVILDFGNLGPFAKQTNNNLPSRVDSTSLNSSNAAEKSAEKTPINNQPTGDSEKNNLSASISYVNQTGSSLKIGTVIDKVSSNGTCKLTISNDSGNYSSSTGIQPLASSSTCKGFEVPIVELSKGIWNITIDITVQSSKAHLTKTFSVS